MSTLRPKNFPHLFVNDRHMHSLLFMHMRHAFKTGLAAAAAFAVSSFFHSQFGLWAVVSTMIVMQGISVADSIQASFSRFTVMSLGALAGMIILVISPAHPVFLTVEVFFICALGAYLGRYGSRFTLATTAVCIVLLVGQQPLADKAIQTQLMLGITLSLEVLIGVTSAIVITALLWPVRLGDTLRSDIAAQFEKCAVLLDTTVKSFLDHQQSVPYSQFEGLELQIRSNRERMIKVRELEAHIYHYEHKGLAIQVDTVERCMEKMRSLIDALNEYDERGYDPQIGPELRELADMLMGAMRRLGGGEAYAPAPEITRGVTLAVDKIESRLNDLRQGYKLHELPLRHIMQLYAFYLGLRHLSETMLSALYQMQLLGEKPLIKKIV